MSHTQGRDDRQCSTLQVKPNVGNFIHEEAQTTNHDQTNEHRTREHLYMKNTGPNTQQLGAFN